MKYLHTLDSRDAEQLIRDHNEVDEAETSQEVPSTMSLNDILDAVRPIWL